MSALPRRIEPGLEPAPTPPSPLGRMRAAARYLGVQWRVSPWTVRASVLCLLLFYSFAAFSPLIAPYNPARQYRELPDCPPMALHLTPPGERSHGWFFAYPMKMVDPLARKFAPDRTRKTYLRFFYHGRLFTTESPDQPWFMLGSEQLGRDLFSRIVYGARVSMLIGLVGVAISFTLGIAVGAFSGYVGGWIDSLIMRWCEIEMSLPQFYFLLALAAVIPAGISTVTRFFLIVAIMAFISWAGFARVIRGMAAAVRSEPYVEAARSLGGSRRRVLRLHVVPALLGFAAVNASLSIPGYILGESALSLLGLGIQEPAASWGNLLSQAMDPQNIQHYPWVLIPGLFISAAVMAFNFLGDHLRDRFDPGAVG
ncbi:MAG TPA: ABC transporter permease [Candidatus Binataceae bacterium]|nr:ABC transporter permease [Candidatus Binataceae bacterium]